MTSETGKYFDVYEIENRFKGFNNKKALEDYVKTGQYDYVPGLRRDSYNSITDLKVALERSNKIH